MKCGKCTHRKVCYIKAMKDNEKVRYDDDFETVTEDNEECGYFDDSGGTSGVCAVCIHRHSDMSGGKMISRCDILKIRFKDIFGFGCRKFEEMRDKNGGGNT